jgi:hypothetical protein
VTNRTDFSSIHDPSRLIPVLEPSRFPNGRPFASSSSITPHFRGSSPKFSYTPACSIHREPVNQPLCDPPSQLNSHPFPQSFCPRSPSISPILLRRLAIHSLIFLPSFAVFFTNPSMLTRHSLCQSSCADSPFTWPILLLSVCHSVCTKKKSFRPPFS